MHPSRDYDPSAVVNVVHQCVLALDGHSQAPVGKTVGNDDRFIVVRARIRTVPLMVHDICDVHRHALCPEDVGDIELGAAVLYDKDVQAAARLLNQIIRVSRSTHPDVRLVDLFRW